MILSVAWGFYTGKLDKLVWLAWREFLIWSPSKNIYVKALVLLKPFKAYSQNTKAILSWYYVYSMLISHQGVQMESLDCDYHFGIWLFPKLIRQTTLMFLRFFPQTAFFSHPVLWRKHPIVYSDLIILLFLQPLLAKKKTTLSMSRRHFKTYFKFTCIPKFLIFSLTF